MRIDDYPKPIQIDGLRQLHTHRHTAGTKEKCVFCGRKTYRYVGNKAVCSYCEEAHKADNVGPSWKSAIMWKCPSLDGKDTNGVNDA